jgi:hypothetical protein
MYFDHHSVNSHEQFGSRYSQIMVTSPRPAALFRRAICDWGAASRLSSAKVAGRAAPGDEVDGLWKRREPITALSWHGVRKRKLSKRLRDFIGQKLVKRSQSPDACPLGPIVGGPTPPSPGSPCQPAGPRLPTSVPPWPAFMYKPGHEVRCLATG